MILVTGGAGFIGSNLQAALSEAGHETVVVDRLGSDGRWRNLAAHPPAAIVAPEALDAFLARRPPVELVFHLGAISDTTVDDADLAWSTNVVLSETLLDWCAANAVRLVYASSAATYGDGARGFEDDETVALAPLNLYGWTKYVFDRKVAARRARSGGAGKGLPPQCAGLRFFNVYGPNEYHKGHMVSVVKRKWDELAAGGPATLFRSDRAGVADGAQSRDFIHVDDVVAVMMWLLATPSADGLFNVGTGISRTYLDLATAVCRAFRTGAMGGTRAMGGTEGEGGGDRIAFVDMPPALRGRYQSFTQASIGKLRRAGYAADFLPLEEGIARYARDHLASGCPYR